MKLLSRAIAVVCLSVFALGYVSNAGAQNSQWTITATAGPGGAISPQGEILVGDGESQAFTITPDRCYQIEDVVVDGLSVGPMMSYEFTNVSADHTIEAQFVTDTLTITARAFAGSDYFPFGWIEPSGDTTVSCGSNLTYSIIADGGACGAIKAVVVDGDSLDVVDPGYMTYTFSDITGDHTIDAHFGFFSPATRERLEPSSVGRINCTAVLVSVASVDASAHRVTIVWHLADASNATVQRQAEGGWLPLATLHADGEGQVRYDDTDVTAGTTYRYRLALVHAGGDIVAGEVQIRVPDENPGRLALDAMFWDRAIAQFRAWVTLPTSTTAKLQIYDSGGRRWSEQRIERQQPGSYAILIPAARVPPGVYFARLLQDGMQARRRFVVFQ